MKPAGTSKKTAYHKPDPRDPHTALMEFIKEDDKQKFIKDDIRQRMNGLRSFSAFKAALHNAKVSDVNLRVGKSLLTTTDKRDFLKMTSMQKRYITTQFDIGNVETPIVIHLRKQNDSFVIYGEEIMQYALLIARKPLKIVRISYS
jgi:hypothetical protein